MTNALSAAELAIYTLLTLPTLYILARHGRHGILGWLAVLVFCTIRVTAGAMSLHRDSSASSIISSIGLSPLLLAALGVLHEGRIYRGLKNTKLEWVLVLCFHTHVVTAVALMASGLSGSHPNMNLVNAGIALMVLAWLALGIWTGVAFSSSQHDRRSPSHPEGTKMVKAVVWALMFIGVRVIYTLVALATQTAYLSPISGALTIRVLFAFLPELVAVLILLAVGWQTRPKSGLATEHERSADQ